MAAYYDLPLLEENLTLLGVTLAPDRLEALDRYAGLLVEWNRKMNLTAITSPQGIAVLHFADSLALLPLLPPTPGARLIDVGTGAGFPALPLLIARPDLQVTLLDGLNKRLTFLQAVLTELGLTAQLCHARAEEAGRDPALRERFDLATARAVASLNVLCEYCLPFVKPGGVFAAMKGPSAQTEQQAAAGALRTLNSRVEQVKAFTLSDGSDRRVLLIRKQGATPAAYPRHGSKIAKKPL